MRSALPAAFALLLRAAALAGCASRAPTQSTGGGAAPTSAGCTQNVTNQSGSAGVNTAPATPTTSPENGAVSCSATGQQGSVLGNQGVTGQPGMGGG